MMIGQDMYGKMRVLPPVKRGAPLAVPCSKCKGEFILEKKHTEVYLIKNLFGRKKDGTLTPGTPEPESFHRLCPGCKIKLDDWFGK